MIGVATTFYGYQGNSQLIDKARKLADVFIDLDLPPLIQLLSSPVGENFDQAIIDLNQLKKKTGAMYSLHHSIWLPSPNFYLNLASNNRDVIRQTIDSLKKSIDFGVAIKAKNLSFHAGYNANEIAPTKEFSPLKTTDPIPEKEAYDNIKKNIIPLLDHAADKINVAIENLCYRPGTNCLFSNSENFKDFKINNLKFLFDFGHAFFTAKTLGDKDYIKKMIETMSPDIAEIHISDNDGTEDQHLLPPKGKIPFSDTFNLVKENQEIPDVIIEAFGNKNDYSEDDLKKGIKFINSLIHS